MPILKKMLKGCADVKQLKGIGRRHTGYLATLPSGKKAYFVVRRNMQMFRGKEYSQSLALEKETATWMIDLEVLRHIAKVGVEVVVVFVKDTADYYVSPLSLWLDKKLAKDIPVARFGECRHLGIHLMSKGTVYSALTLQRL
jgi:hypothetical protein